MFGDAWNSREVRLGAKCQNEVIKRQFSAKRADAVGNRHSPSRKIDRFYIRTQYGDVPKQLAKWIADVGGLEITSRHLIEHGGKKSEVISADKGDLDIGALCRGPIEVSRGLYAGESAPQNNDLCFSIDFTHHIQVPQV
jgi:hypothetical protein